MHPKTSLYLPRFIKGILTSSAWAGGNITQNNLIKLQLEPNASNHYTATRAARLSYSHVSIIPFHSFKIQHKVKNRHSRQCIYYMTTGNQQMDALKDLVFPPKKQMHLLFKISSHFKCFIQRALLFKLRTHTEPTRHCYRPT